MTQHTYLVLRQHDDKDTTLPRFMTPQRLYDTTLSRFTTPQRL